MTQFPGQCGPYPRSKPLALLVLVGVLVLLAFITHANLQPPAPVPANAPTGTFSAERAAATLRTILGDQRPHPVGSEALSEIRQRLRAELEELGLDVTEQSVVHCRPGTCVPVHNLVATVAGDAVAPPILMMAHVDSTPCSPGASDDGSGVAVLLECARALLNSDHLPRPVTLLFTDGEEVGCFGARAFVDGMSPEQGFHAIVNVDTGQTDGPAVISRTAGADLWITAAVANQVPGIIAGTAWHELFRRSPFDTDLSAFLDGFFGLDIGIVGGRGRYHTRFDDLDHVDLGGLQDLGDSTLGAVRGLAIAEPRTGHAVAADLPGIGLVHWPASWNRGITIATGLAVMVLLLALLWRRKTSVGQLLWGSLLVPTSLSASAGLTETIQALIEHRAGARPYTYDPGPGSVAFIASSILVVLAATALLCKRARPLAIAGAGWFWWALAAMLAVWNANWVTPLLVIPLVIAVLLHAFTLAWPRTRVVATSLPALAGAALWLPVMWGIENGFAASNPGLLAVATTLMLIPFAPAAAEAGRGAVLYSMIVVALATAAGGTLMASRSSTEADEQRPFNLACVEDREVGTASWLAMVNPAFPNRLLAPLGFSWAEKSSPLWSAYKYPIRPATPTTDEGAIIETTQLEENPENDPRTLHAHLYSPRGSREVMLAFGSGDLVRIAVSGIAVLPEIQPFHHQKLVRIIGLPAEGIELELVLGTDPATLTLIDVADGLPDTDPAREMSSLRSTAAPRGRCDIHAVITRYIL